MNIEYFDEELMDIETENTSEEIENEDMDEAIAMIGVFGNMFGDLF